MMATTRFGSLMACDVSDLIQTYIYYFGVWEPNLTAFLQRRLRCGDGFIDVGANIGYFSLLASTKVGHKGKIVAIEASAKIYGEMVANVLRNNVTNIRMVNAAASDHHGIVTLYCGAPGNQGSTTMLNEFGGAGTSRVAAIPFDELLSPEELACARIVKIDIEGAELPVLERIWARIRDFREDIEFVVELDPLAILRAGSSTDMVIERFRLMGFQCYSLDNEFVLSRYRTTIETVPPTRLRSAIRERGDFVFSRRTGDSL